MPGPSKPVLGVGERLEDADRHQACLEHAFEKGGAVGDLAGAQTLHHGLAVNNFDVLVLGECPISRGRGRGEMTLERGDEGRSVGRDAGLLGVARNVAMIVIPGNKLVAVVAVFLAARDAQIA